MDNEENSSFGAILKKYRKDSKLTQAKLAKAAGISAGYINLLEKGERKPSNDIIFKIAGALQLNERGIPELLKNIEEKDYKVEDKISDLFKSKIAKSVEETLRIVNKTSKNRVQIVAEKINKSIENIKKEYLDQVEPSVQFEKGIWDYEIICGFSGFQDTAIASFVTQSLRINSIILPWDKIPEHVNQGNIHFAVHNVWALFKFKSLVFCKPPLFRFSEHEFFISKDYREQLKLKKEERRQMKIAVARDTDLQLAVYEVMKKLELKSTDIDWKYQDSDEGLTAFLSNEVDGYCGGLNHAHTLRSFGFEPLFKTEDIKIDSFDGIITTQEFYKENKELLKLFMLTWFRTIKLIKDNKEDNFFLNNVVKEINSTTSGKINPLEFKAILNEEQNNEQLYVSFKESENDSKKDEKFDKQIEQIMKFYNEEGRAFFDPKGRFRTFSDRERDLS